MWFWRCRAAINVIFCFFPVETILIARIKAVPRSLFMVGWSKDIRVFCTVKKYFLTKPTILILNALYHIYIYIHNITYIYINIYIYHSIYIYNFYTSLLDTPIIVPSLPFVSHDRQAEQLPSLATPATVVGCGDFMSDSWPNISKTKAHFHQYKT